MHVVFEVLASAILAANWFRLPVGTETVPDPSLLLVARAIFVLAVRDVFERQGEL